MGHMLEQGSKKRNNNIITYHAYCRLKQNSHLSRMRMIIQTIRFVNMYYV